MTGMYEGTSGASRTIDWGRQCAGKRLWRTREAADLALPVCNAWAVSGGAGGHPWESEIKLPGLNYIAK